MLKEKIEEVNEIIREKVLTGDYKFFEYNSSTIKLKIDDCCTITILALTHAPEESFVIYNFIGNEINFTLDERVKAWSLLKPHVKEYKEKELKRQKAEKIKELEKELADMG